MLLTQSEAVRQAAGITLSLIYLISRVHAAPASYSPNLARQERLPGPGTRSARYQGIQARERAIHWLARLSTMAAPSFVPISFNATASSYIAHVRLPPGLMQKLEAEGASDMSISLSEGVLSVGGESYKLDAVPEEGSFDVVREHGSKMCSVGAVRDKIHIKQTLNSAGRAQIKQRTAQGERDAHGHQTVMGDAPPPAAKRKTPPASKQVAKPSQQQRAKSARPLSTSPQGGAMSGTMTAPTGRTGSSGGLDDLRRWCASRPPHTRA